jgi:ubiquinone biosynthesis protein
MTAVDPLPIPPLPNLREVAPFSDWLGAREGLRASAQYWLEVAPPHREKLAREARRISRPSVGWPSLSALARTGGRVVRTIGVDGFTEIFQAAGDARRVRDGKPLKERDRSGSSVAVERARELVEAGGPAYVKLGQFIATARGILPLEWVEAFEWCRDEVPPLRPGKAESIIQRTFERPVDELFASFDTEPIAAASIAQVHRAVLLDGSDVVVKVRRPGLRRKFIEDIRVMALLSAGAERVSPEARMANLSGFVELFANIVLEELDFRLEATNIVESALASEGAGHNHVNYPRPVPEMAASNVLVMERVPGVRYTDAMEAYPGKVDGDKLLRLAIQSVLEQTLIYGIFHGDLHAGNVFIDPEGRFSLVDFGILGRFNAEQRAAMVRFMVGFANNDVRAQLEAMREFGAVPDEADFEELVRELQTYADEAMDLEIKAGQMDQNLEELAESMSQILRLLTKSGFVAPKELVLFLKNILYLNGFAVALAPNANLMDEIQPIFMYFASKYPEALGLMSGGG